MMLHLSFDYNSNGHTTTDSTRDDNNGLSSDSRERETDRERERGGKRDRYELVNIFNG